MPVQYGDVQLTWLGHDGFLIAAGKRIYIDPYQIDPRDKPVADILLITHSHYDHLSIADIEHLVTPQTTVLCPPDCSSKLAKLKMKLLKPVAPGDVVEIEDIHIQAVPAYNVDKPFHPRENDWVGYLITVAGVTIYHTGDSDVIPEMRDIECDIALLPVSGKYVMDVKGAVEAAEMIKPSVVIPMHWGALVGTIEDAQQLKKLLKTDVVILEKE
jgi:L-ascorbate metabolism protein UlaG (beta-lactamase superfamily)